MMSPEQIINGIRSEAIGINREGGFPLHVFPQKIQSVVLDWKEQDDFRPEYTCAAILSAVSSAVGNAYHLRVRGAWTVNPAMYLMLVGRPGLGKTPPFNAVYHSIRTRDRRLIDEYRTALAEYEEAVKFKGKKSEQVENEAEPKKPVLIQTMLDDCTQEALMKFHFDNPRGVTISGDEIIGFFSTVNRYNNSNMIESLLSAFSGSPLKKTRASEDVPCFISNPCVNVIGNIQTKVVPELFSKGYDNNGLIDRFMFVSPIDQSVSLWPMAEQPVLTRPTSPYESWERIITKLMDVKYEPDENGEYRPHVLQFSDDARLRFYSWRNEMVEGYNANPDDEDSRIMKVIQNTARLSLNMQLLRWACDEFHLEFVDLVSVEAAISLVSFFESCFKRMLAISNVDVQSADRNERFLDALGDEFTTQEAYQVGKAFMLKPNSVLVLLRTLCKEGKIALVKKGNYIKTPPKSSSTSSSSSTFSPVKVDKVEEVDKLYGSQPSSLSPDSNTIDNELSL